MSDEKREPAQQHSIKIVSASSAGGRFPLEEQQDRETFEPASHARRILIDKYGITVPFQTLEGWANAGHIHAKPSDKGRGYSVGMNSTTVFAMNWWLNKKGKTIL
jgi:hypothetical protein